MEMPALAKAVEYLFKSVPSSKVSPSVKPSIRAKIVLNEVPTTSALWRVLSTTVAKAAVEKISNTAMRLSSGSGLKKGLAMGVVGLAAGLIASGYASGNPLNDANPETVTQEGGRPAPMMFGPDGQKMIPNNTSGYIINIKGDTKKGNRQLKKALKQATARTTGSTGITMNVKTSQTSGAYSDKDIENILNNYF